MYDMLKEYIKPELLVLVPVLYLVGAALKQSAVRRKYVPWILGAAGVALSFLWTAATSPLSSPRAVLLAVFSGLVQGVLTAGASVGIGQIVKQCEKKK